MIGDQGDGSTVSGSARRERAAILLSGMCWCTHAAPPPNPRADHPSAVAACRAEQIEPAVPAAPHVPTESSIQRTLAKGDHDAKRRAALSAERAWTAATWPKLSTPVHRAILALLDCERGGGWPSPTEAGFTA